MFSIDSTSLGTALRFLRARQGLTQGVVAARAKLTKAMLSSYEIGSKLPSFQSLAAILEALNRDFHDLQEALDEIRQRAPASSGGPVDPQSLGKALRLLRTRQNVTQVSIADRAGLTKAMLSCYETGAQLPSMHSLASTLKALGADFHDLQDALDQVQEQEQDLQPEPEPEEAPKPKKKRKKAQAGAQA
jgi:transcriptional regulator with XRE-family HTH domain